MRYHTLHIKPIESINFTILMFYLLNGWRVIMRKAYSRHLTNHYRQIIERARILFYYLIAQIVQINTQIIQTFKLFDFGCERTPQYT